MEPEQDVPAGTTQDFANGGADDGAVVQAAGLGLRGRRGWVYAEVDLRVGAGALVAVAGPGGSGRTSLLLTVAGRMKQTTGMLRVCGHDLPGEAARVRRCAAVARATGAAELEPDLRVREHVRERLLTLRDVPAGAFDDARALVGLEASGKELVHELPSSDATRLALALALLGSPAVIVLDDLDDGADAADQYALWQAARRAADTGPVVLAAATEPSPAEGLADALVELTRARPATGSDDEPAAENAPQDGDA
ncbi:ATP-binding cassette domain-containing protein [Actinomadura hibisca]|uniref:ATP-binding cassette domain-containing protein n=1 Tax=Actinomadura hibisca TaxID=68565 RepID=UPI0008376B8A|nr:ATP-binding cassette domain-containing protein [Actinomadura hibisca]